MQYLYCISLSSFQNPSSSLTWLSFVKDSLRINNSIRVEGELSARGYYLYRGILLVLNNDCSHSRARVWRERICIKEDICGICYYMETVFEKHSSIFFHPYIDWSFQGVGMNVAYLNPGKVEVLEWVLLGPKLD
jgi:hypothetical protein